jgi:hypothetical protein
MPWLPSLTQVSSLASPWVRFLNAFHAAILHKRFAGHCKIWTTGMRRWESARPVTKISQPVLSSGSVHSFWQSGCGFSLLPIREIRCSPATWRFGMYSHPPKNLSSFCPAISCSAPGKYEQASGFLFGPGRLRSRPQQESTVRGPPESLLGENRRVFSCKTQNPPMS